MSVSYKELLQQRAELEQRISAARQEEISEAIGQIRTLIADFGLTSEDIFPTAKPVRSSSLAGGKVAPKYMDPATGKTWTGRGKAPKWIEGQERTQFLIAG